MTEGTKPAVQSMTIASGAIGGVVTGIVMLATYGGWDDPDPNFLISNIMLIVTGTLTIIGRYRATTRISGVISGG